VVRQLTNQTGCALGTVLGAFLAAHPEDKLVAVLAGLLTFEIAAENAAQKDSVHGPGTFIPAFLDELHVIRQATLNEQDWYSDRIKISLVDC
jgi:thiamine-phosphate diphosphorylase / hydroxyethylthiazole kinase